MSPVQKLITKIRRKGAQGMLEFALILPVFLLLVFGVIEAARLMMTYTSVYTASREGARYAAAVGEVSGIARYKDCTGIRNATISNGFLAGVEASGVDIRYDTGPDDGRAWDDLPACPSNALLGDRVMVRVSVTYEPIVPLVNFPPLTITNTDGRTIVLDFQVMGTAPASPTPKATRTPVPTNTPPELILPADITAEATSSLGALVSFEVTASDFEDPSPDIACTLNPGGNTFPGGTYTHTYPVGITTVECTVTDYDGGTTTDSFTVTVTDNTPPAITSHANVGPVEATGAAGAAVSFSIPTAVDIVDGAVAVTCSPDSGSTFGIATTTVTCTTMDSHSNTASTTFNVNVVHTAGPVIAPHADVGPVPATSPSGAVVTYTSPSTLDVVDGSGTATCSPASGTTYPVGTTIVTCNATDLHGNPATPTTFNVTVSDYVNICTTIVISGITRSDIEYTFEVQNTDSATHRIDSFTISWTGTSTVTSVSLGSSTIWSGSGTSPLSGTTSNDPSLPNGSKHMEFHFSSPYDHTAESVQLNFSSGCYVTIP